MSFDFSTLITDRTNADVSALYTLLSKKLGTWTPEELEQFNSGLLKGGYWWTDLNRVSACMKYLDEELRGLGYESGYIPVIVHPQKDPIRDENTVFLLHGEAILDSSLYGVQVTNNGVQVSDSQSKFGGKSLYFGGESFLAAISNDFIFQNHDFTIDWWEYRENDGTFAAVNIFNDNNKSNFLISHMDGTSLYGSSRNQGWDIFRGLKVMGPKKNAWSHKALIRNGDEFSVYVDGKNTYRGAFSFSLVLGTGKIFIGRHAQDSNPDYFLGYVDEFRISNVARWASDFTPPESPYIVEYDPDPGPALDPYTWYKEDNPTSTQMAQYLANVSKIRSALGKLQEATEVPSSLKKLTVEKANAIEKILVSVESAIDGIKSTLNLGWAFGIADIGLYGGV